MKITDEWLQESAKPKLLDALVLNDSCLVLPDIELPFHNAQFINKSIKLAHSRGIRKLIVAGDWMHYASLAHFPGSEKDLESEINAVEEHISPFLEAFDEIYYIAGNHDVRPQQTLDRILGQDKMIRLVVPPEFAEEFASKVKASNYFYMHVGKGEEAWRIVHPKATNTVPANAAKALATKFNCNVAMGHDHLIGLQQTPDGRHVGIEMGCCVDPQRLGYFMMRDMTRPMMMNGALILEKDGKRFYPTLITEQWTDWREIEKQSTSARNKERRKGR